MTYFTHGKIHITNKNNIQTFSYIIWWNSLMINTLSHKKSSMSRAHSKPVRRMCVCSLLCLILCDSMNSNPPGSSVHGIVQARLLEWVAISSSRGSSLSRDRTRVSFVSCTARQILCHWVTWEVHINNIKEGKYAISELALLCWSIKQYTLTNFMFSLITDKGHFNHKSD